MREYYQSKRGGLNISPEYFDNWEGYNMDILQIGTWVLLVMCAGTLVLAIFYSLNHGFTRWCTNQDQRGRGEIIEKIPD
jgi:hypothetical protein